MKHLGKILLSILAIGSASCSLFAQDPKWDKHDWKDTKEDRNLLDYKYGPRNYEGKIFPELLVQGPLKIRDVKVGGATVTYGPINARASELNTLKVYGPSMLIETNLLGWVNVYGPLKAFGSTFKKEVEVKGPLQAEETTFSEELSVRAKVVELTNCQLKSIVLKSKSKKGVKLYLAGKTIVDGTITFRGKTDQCEVFIEPESQVKGEIIGAKVIRK